MTVHDRYHRQRLLPDFGDVGQERLAASHAVVVGCGALGCTVSDLLARAGVGRLTVIDRDVVEETNLQRQSLFAQTDLGFPKAEAARRRLVSINSGIEIAAHVADFTAANARKLAGLGPGSHAPAVLIDGTDNFETRLLINDLAVAHSVPYVYAGAVGTRGMVMTILPGKTPCLRCIVPEPPPPGSQPTCDTVGVLGPVIAIVAGAEAAEALKVLVGRSDLLNPAMLDFDLWTNERRRLEVGKMKDPDCPCCARRSFDYLEGGAGTSAVALCGRGSIQIAPASASEHAVDLLSLSNKLRPHGDFTATRFLVRGVLAGERDEADGPIELTIFTDGRAIIKGVLQPERARSIYAKYIGL